MSRTWIITGATSIIAEEFARIAASHGHQLRLIGRNPLQLNIIAKDIEIRYRIRCEVMLMDWSDATNRLHPIFLTNDTETDLFIGHSDFTENAKLSSHSIRQLIHTNILSTIQLIDTYLKSPQKKHHLLYLSSIAACRGRSKNSLYGASKSAIETYLEGLQQASSKDQYITIARLGYIDTRQTYGLPGIFYAAPPQVCAKACWNALQKKKRLVYYPKFWRAIAAILTRIPFFMFQRINNI